MKSSQARMKSSAFRLRWNEIRLSYPRISGISSHSDFIHEVDLFRQRRISLKKAHIVLVDKCVLFLVETGRLWTQACVKMRCSPIESGIARWANATHCESSSTATFTQKEKMPLWDIFSFWWKQGDSNSRPHGCEPCALTNWAMLPRDADIIAYFTVKSNPFLKKIKRFFDFRRLLYEILYEIFKEKTHRSF